ncbi:MAG: hypothetical protein DRR08_18710 [Candidatus Parabeggiatoa sp. nov. 2]|nr:MAG: hypothetical protein DRR08_18710 [Gammaproteobacteria bacterium]
MPIKRRGAHFQKKALKLKISMPENGTVEILPEKAERHCGDTVFLIAKPQHIFSCWQPNDVFEHPLDLTLKKDMDITAVFELEDKQIPVSEPITLESKEVYASVGERL